MYNILGGESLSEILKILQPTQMYQLNNNNNNPSEHVTPSSNRPDIPLTTITNTKFERSNIKKRKIV